MPFEQHYAEKVTPYDSITKSCAWLFLSEEGTITDVSCGCHAG